MKSNNFKHAYAILLLGLTFLWACFCVWITYMGLKTLNITTIVVSSGCDVFLGALIVWNGNINQHYFRKSTPEDKPPVEPPGQ